MTASHHHHYHHPSAAASSSSYMQRCNSWNPHAHGHLIQRGMFGPDSRYASYAANMPNRVATVTDVRYRSFHNHLPFNVQSQPSKSRASLALPPPSHHHQHHQHHQPAVFASSSYLAFPPTHDVEQPYSDIPGPYYSCGTSCNCMHDHHNGHFHGAYPSLPPPPPPPQGRYMAASTHDLASHCRNCGSSLYPQQQQQQSGRFQQRHRGSQRATNNNNNNGGNKSSLRWTSEQLNKFDNLIVKEPNSSNAKSNKNPRRNGSCSSSSGDTVTDDSGVHSRSTGKDSPPNPILDPVRLERVSLSRRPIRKLPMLPPKQAHIVKLNMKQQRTLPPVPNKQQEKTTTTTATQWIKHGRLSNFFRSVKLNRSSKKLQSCNNVTTRVFGKDLQELSNSTGLEVPEVLLRCTKFVEEYGLVDGIYRVSGIASNIKRLRSMFDSATIKNLNDEDWISQDLHCVPSLVKLFFRELPEPLCAEDAYPLLKKGAAIAILNSDTREAMPYFRDALGHLGKAQYCTLRHLMLHLQRVSERVEDTGMTGKNLAIVWAPNLLRTPLLPSSSSTISTDDSGLGGDQEQQQQQQQHNGSSKNNNDHARLQYNLVQNTQIVQYLIENAKWLFQLNNSSTNQTESVQEQNLKNIGCRYSYASNNVHPPQYLERVRFITTEQKQIPLSKRYTSSSALPDEKENYHHQRPHHEAGLSAFQSNNLSQSMSTSAVNGIEIYHSNPVQSKDQGIIRRLWNRDEVRPVNDAGRPLSMDAEAFQSLDNLQNGHQLHHPLTHRHIHVKPAFVTRTNVSHV